MAVPCRDVAVMDEGALGTYASSEWAERQFCRHCGTSLFWRMRGDKSGHVAVSFQSFDDLPPVQFVKEIFIDEKPALYSFAGYRRLKTGAEVIAEFEATQNEGAE